jgi:hypothetical protein
LICGGIALDLLDRERCGRGCGFTRRIFGIAWNLDYLSDGHAIGRNLRVCRLQILGRNAELKSNAADRVTGFYCICERRGAGKRRLCRDQAFGSLTRTLGGGGEWDQVSAWRG